VTAPVSPGDPVRLGPRDLLRLADFRRIWFAGGIGWVMRWFEVLAIGVYVFALTNSPLIVSLVTVARFVPVMLFSAFTGAIAEQLNRRVMLMCGLGTLCAVAVTLGMLAITGQIEIWHIAAGSFVSGLYFTMDFPVRRTMLGEIAGAGGIAPAMAIDTATNHSMRVVGPALGGLALEFIGLHGVYFTGAALYAIAFLLIMRTTNLSGGRTGAGLRVIRQIREGLSYVRGQPRIMATLAVTVIANIFGFPFAIMVPVIGRDVLSLDAFWTGTLQSMEGMGALIGSLFIANLIRPAGYIRLYAAGTGLFLTGVLMLSLADGYSASLVFMLATGLGVSGFAAMQSTIVFTSAPPDMRSRLMGVLAVCIGLGPVGMLHIGFLAEHFGAQIALRVSAVEGLCALAVVWFLWPKPRQ
jgi:MFS family permease